ncbi:858_t:CDS:2, partial [Dentiscutata erythropus]
KDEFECFKDTKVEDDMKAVLNIIHASRSIRQQNNVTPGKFLPFFIWTDIPELINNKSQIIKYFPNIKEFIKASDIQVISSVESEKNIQMTQLLNNSAVNLIAPNLKVYVPMTAILEVQSTSIDVTDTELNRLTKKYEKITKELETLKERIENASYLKKVPDRIKEIDRKRLENLEELKKDLEKNVKLVQNLKE